MPSVKIGLIKSAQLPLSLIRFKTT